jgi:hypothetical protein
MIKLVLLANITKRYHFSYNNNAFHNINKHSIKWQIMTITLRLTLDQMHLKVVESLVSLHRC